MSPDNPEHQHKAAPSGAADDHHKDNSLPRHSSRARSARRGGQNGVRTRKHAALPNASPELPARSVFRAAVRPRTPLFVAAAILLLLMIAGGFVLAQDSVPAKTTPVSGASLDLVRLMMQFALVGVLVLMSAFFAMAEIALITVRKTRIRQLVEEGNKSALLVAAMLSQPTQMMATIQTGVTLVASFSSAIAAAAAVEPLSDWLRSHGNAVLSQSAGTVALIAVTLPVAIFTLVIGEIAPKSLAVRYSEKIALIAVHPVRALQTVMAPVVGLLTLLSNLVVRPFGGTASFTQSIVNEEELKMMVEASEEQGVLEAEETEMIHSILSFGDTVVRKAMTPRIDLTAIEVNHSLTDLARLAHESGHSRIPVYEGSLDDIIGIAYAKDLLPLLMGEDQRDVSLRSVVRPAYIIPENKKVDELLAEFQRSKQQIAIVSDEYGVTAGLITIEDLLEEIVGDIQDEYDREEPPVLVVDGMTTILDGKMILSDVNDRMGLSLPDEESDTIGGFVFGLLGHQATVGESVCWNDVEFHVDATDGRRIQKVRIVKRQASDQEETMLFEDAGHGQETKSREQTLK